MAHVAFLVMSFRIERIRVCGLRRLSRYVILHRTHCYPAHQHSVSDCVSDSGSGRIRRADGPGCPFTYVMVHRTYCHPAFLEHVRVCDPRCLLTYVIVHRTPISTDYQTTRQGTNEFYNVIWLHSRLRQDVVSKRKRVVGGLYGSILNI